MDKKTGRIIQGPWKRKRLPEQVIELAIWRCLCGRSIATLKMSHMEMQKCHGDRACPRCGKSIRKYLGPYSS